MESLRKDTVVSTVRAVIHRHFGDSVEVPDDVISALLVLGAKIGGSVTVDDNAQLFTNSELDELLD